MNVADGAGTVTFAFSEAAITFILADTSAVGGTLSNLQQINATHYTATFEGAVNTEISTASVNVTAGSYQDLTGNVGAGSSTGSFVVDTVTPTVMVSIDNTDVNVANSTATVTFTFSKSPTDFTLNDVTSADGSLSNLRGSGTIYTATFTANPGVEDNAATVSVINGSYHDAAGNTGAGTMLPVQFSSAIATFYEVQNNWAPSQMIDGIFTGPPPGPGQGSDWGGVNGWSVMEAWRRARRRCSINTRKPSRRTPVRSNVQTDGNDYGDPGTYGEILSLPTRRRHRHVVQPADTCFDGEYHFP